MAATLRTTRASARGIARDAAGGYGVRVDRQRGRVAQAACLVEDEIVEVDGSGRQAQHVLVGAGQEQQIVDEMLHAEVLGEHVLGELASTTRRSRMRERDLGVLPYRRDWRTQFVRGVRR